MSYIFIKIIYALSRKQYIFNIKTKNGNNINYILKNYNLYNKIPKIKIKKNNIGIYGKIVNKNYILKNGDQIEIYRDLLKDPREILRKRAKLFKNKKI
ncbi:Persistence and stress-resistance antitoxin PasI [Candidatus Annandia adelgestsuga]|uniref:UPF0125 protein C3B56_00029 n=1 Tax=Candidatus Annandia adelgestsuga TaxID=1302411 RepID=A0A3S9J7D2_9ENTR|nr:RnfH family protein [Candidatus Annandia adelgestsuga]AZP36157.1 Persistence and stress-resistance antitoxin PasI [Candidatus Annandia adelgestsuga]